MSKVYRFGLLGCGNMGKKYIHTINQFENAEIVHICTTKPENAKLCTNVAYTTKRFEEVISNPSLSGIIIATPPHLHGQAIHEAIMHVLPFIVEKPFCLSLKETSGLVESIKRSRTPCLVDHTQLFNPAFKELAAMTRADKIHSIKSTACSFGPFRKDVPMYWDWLPHDLSMVLTILKEMPTKVRMRYAKGEDYDNSGKLNVKMIFKKTEVEINVDNTHETKYRSFVTTSNIKTMTVFERELYETREDKMRTISVSNEMPLKLAVDDFITAIETNMQVGLDMAEKVAKIIDKCALSLENNSTYILLD